MTTQLPRASSRKTEMIGIRLDPRQRYLAEIAARQQRRSLSSFIDWSIHRSLSLVEIGPGSKTVADMAESLWDVAEPDRIAKLALHYPHLLTHEEQTLWKLVWENRLFWRAALVKETGGWERSDKTLDLKILREKWLKLLLVAKGQASEDTIR